MISWRSCARGAVFALASVVVLCDAVLAADGRRVAFVVGNGGYAHAAELKNPTNDADIIAKSLADVGFEVIRGSNLTRRQFEDKIKEFATRLAGAQEAVFFYAGHGMQVSGQNYLIPVDAKLAAERELAFETIPLDLIQTQMELERADKTSIIILDACRDNPFTKSLARSMGTRSASVQRGLAQVQTGSGTFIAFATRPGDVAQDGAGDNSPFTQALVGRMKAPGRPLASIMIDVRNDVRRATANAQTPWDHSSLTGEFYFVAPRQGSAPLAAAAAQPSDYDAVRRRNDELEKRLAAITKQQAVLPPTASPVTGPGGCRIVERTLAATVPVAQGTRLCSRDGVSRADIKVVNRYAIVFSVDGRDTTCKPQDVCQFNWPNAPIFKVRLTEESEGGKVSAELVPQR